MNIKLDFSYNSSWEPEDLSFNISEMVELEVEPTDTVLSVKEKIFKITKIQPKYQFYDLAEKPVHNDDTLEEVEVEENSVIVTLIRRVSNPNDSSAR